MDLKKQPGITFNFIALLKETFKRDLIVPEDSAAVIDLKVNNQKDKNDPSKLIVEMIATAKYTHDSKEVLCLESTFIGNFSALVGEENMSLDEFSSNAPALMFPYIREHISAITQKAGVKPILLQPLNFVALQNNQIEEPQQKCVEPESINREKA